MPISLRSTRLRTPRIIAVAMVLAVVAVSGCAKGSSTTSAGTSAGASAAVNAPPSPTVSPCPAPPVVSPQHWPIEVPADLPRPASAVISNINHASGVTIVRFSTADSLRNSVIFVVNELRKVGYVLGRGDAEPVEADAPFTRGEIRGVLRMVATAECNTTWLLAVALPKNGPGTGPNLPSYHATSSASPLPFG